MNDFYFELLNLEINDICITIHRFKNTINSIAQKIMQTLPPISCQRFFKLQSKKAHRVILSHKKICKYKF